MPCQSPGGGYVFDFALKMLRIGFAGGAPRRGNLPDTAISAAPFTDH
jgi:hypothetical protein